MELKIKHNDELYTYEGTSVVFAVQRGGYAEGALMGSRVECMTLLISLIKKFVREESPLVLHAFFDTLKQQLREEVE